MTGCDPEVGDIVLYILEDGTTVNAIVTFASENGPDGVDLVFWRIGSIEPEIRKGTYHAFADEGIRVGTWHWGKEE